MVQRSEDNSNEVDVKELQLPRPSPVEESATLDIVANIALLEGTDRTRWKIAFFEVSVANARAKIVVFCTKLKCSLLGILLVVFWSIFDNLTNFRIFVEVELTIGDCNAKREVDLET